MAGELNFSLNDAPVVYGAAHFKEAEAGLASPARCTTAMMYRVEKKEFRILMSKSYI